MRLNAPLVTSFIFNDKEYNIDLTFDNVLDVFDYLMDEKLRGDEKARICLPLLLDDQEYDVSDEIELWNYIYDEFIKMDSKQTIEYDLKGNPLPQVEEEQKNLIDFEQDAEFIFASFKQAYNINLFEQHGKMHWSEFRALLNGLPRDTIMQRIIQIRMWKPSKGETEEQKQNMRKLQKVYALKEVDDE